VHVAAGRNLYMLSAMWGPGDYADHHRLISRELPDSTTAEVSILDARRGNTLLDDPVGYVPVPAVLVALNCLQYGDARNAVSAIVHGAEEHAREEYRQQNDRIESGTIAAIAGLSRARRIAAAGHLSHYQRLRLAQLRHALLTTYGSPQAVWALSTSEVLLHARGIAVTATIPSALNHGARLVRLDAPDPIRVLLATASRDELRLAREFELTLPQAPEPDVRLEQFLELLDALQYAPPGPLLDRAIGRAGGRLGTYVGSRLRAGFDPASDPTRDQQRAERRAGVSALAYRARLLYRIGETAHQRRRAGR
jgi:hypothetical protein